MADATRNVITIVSGLPRSGTSMMMRMLDVGGIPALTDHIRKPDEDNPRGYFEFEAVKQTKQDPSWLKSAGGKAVKMVYRLLYDLPPDYEYRVIFMKRNLQEVVASQDVMLDRRGRKSDQLGHDKLIALFEQQLRDFDAWIAKRANFKILYISYNEALRNPQPTIQALNDFLGGQLNVAAMKQVVEPELYRQRAKPA